MCLCPSLSKAVKKRKMNYDFFFLNQFPPPYDLPVHASYLSIFGCEDFKNL